MLTKLAVERAIRDASIANERVKVFDGAGSCLFVKSRDSRGWRFKYRVAGREKLLSFGAYPDGPTALARERREEVRRHLAAGRDPSAVRKSAEGSQQNDFRRVATELLLAQANKLDPGTLAQKTAWLEKRDFPSIGQVPIAEVLAPPILALLRRIEATGRQETARRFKTAIVEVR